MAGSGRRPIRCRGADRWDCVPSAAGHRIRGGPKSLHLVGEPVARLGSARRPGGCWRRSNSFWLSSSTVAAKIRPPGGDCCCTACCRWPSRSCPGLISPAPSPDGDRDPNNVEPDRSRGVDARFDGGTLGEELVSIAHWRSHVRIVGNDGLPETILLRHEGRSAFRFAGVVNAPSVEPLLPLPRPVAPGRRDDPW